MFRKISAYLASALAVVLLLGAPVRSQLVSKDRVVRPVDISQPAIVNGTAHPLARPQFDQGPVNSDQPISGAVVFRLSPAQQSDLDRLLRDQQNPASPSYHKWLTPEQYAERFGMTANDLAKASAWLKSQGLAVNGYSRGRTEIHFSGQAGTVENAFGTELHKYVVRGKEHFANATALSVPQSFADVVLTVRGLDDFKPKPMLRPHFTSSISGSHFLNPKDFAVIYKLNPLYTANLDGSGIKIAVTGQSEIATNNATTDLDAFRTAAGLSPKDPTFVLVPNTGAAAVSSNSGDQVESDLDLEWSNGVAPNADVIFVYSGNNPSSGAFDAIQYAVDQNLAPIISNSYGLCEADFGSANAQSLWQMVRQANTQGQTMTTASGDDGAADCDGDQATPPKTAKKGLTVDIPAAIPEVTGVGGTEFTGDAAGAVTGTAPNTCADGTNFWDASPGTPPSCDLTSPVATAKGYIPEIVWNDTTQDQQLAAGGGGASIFFAKPSWQSGTGVPADGARDVPDVSLNASPDHDPYLICSQASFADSNPPLTSCPNPTTDGFRASDNQTLAAVGGTSAGAPTFAGILALILQKTGGTGLGNVNPMLYSLAASSPGAFHDIISGNNKVPCTAGTTNCPAGTTMIGFSAAQGYDQATGLGSVDASALETAWLAAIASPPADFIMDGQASTVSAPGQAGSPAIINITAANGFADTVNLTCTPSSSTAQISCSLNPTSVTLSGSTKTASSTLSITTVAALHRPVLPHSRGIWFAATGGLFAAVLLGGIPSRRRWTGLFSLVLVATAIGALGCGGGGGSSTPQQKVQGTPTGSYVITVTGTGANSGTTHTLNVSLTVK